MMQPRSSDLPLTHPFPTAPAFGEIQEPAPGILWLRLPLPFRLNHVNVYLIEDGDGYALLDTGIDDEPTRAIWTALFAGLLAERPLTRIIVTHHHPDHVGSADWLVRRSGLRLEMSEAEYLSSLVLHLDPAALEADPYRRFYVANGLDPATTDLVVTQGHRYLRMLSGLPATFRRIVAGEKLIIGGRVFDVLTGGGHAPEQIMLHCADEKVFLSADQVLARISPNVSVFPRDPEGDPLGIYLRSLRELTATIPEDVLVLPGHDLPFLGLHQRTEAIRRHHEERCSEIAETCREAPLSGAELVPILFRRELDPHQTGFAFAEAMAHVNYMRRRGRLSLIPGPDGIDRFRSA
jgi:glyoxylase-like metal-dependent hydrolase (beta-lactamase superfamily II)